MSRIPVKISFLWDRKHGIFAAASFAASVTLWYLRNNMHNITFLNFLNYVTAMLRALFVWRGSHDSHFSTVKITYRGWLKFRRVPIFVFFVEGPIHKFHYQRNGNFLYELWKQNTMATNFEPQECVIFVQYTKLVPTKKKAIRSNWCYKTYETLNKFKFHGFSDLNSNLSKH